MDDCFILIILRKRLSAVKGGKLARLVAPARVLGLIVSDIVGDPVDMIASGPTIIPGPKRNTSSPLDILSLYNLTEKIPQHVLAVLAEQPVQERRDADVVNLLIGTNDIPLQHARRMLASERCQPLILSRGLTGEARMVGRHLASLVRAICLQNKQDLDTVTEQLKLCPTSLNDVPDELPVGQTLVLLIGGETTVKVAGEGLGGRNQELVLSYAIEMAKNEDRRMQERGFRVELLSCGTDGIDGPTEAAGAVWSSDLNLDLQLASEALENNDSNTFWRRHHPDCLVVTGHTGTNVADLIICKIHREEVSPS